MSASGEPLEHQGWYRTWLVGPRTWAIDDHGQDTMYLVAGEERCLLVDTGWGVGDLPALVASLCPLPVVVVNTHGHPDHACGDGQFARVHFGKPDEWLLPCPLSTDARRWIRENVLKEVPVGFDPDAWAAKAPESPVPIEDGHVFDLGGRIVEAIAAPGHTPGSLCLLDRTGRQLLTGDTALAGSVWMHLEESVPLRRFHASLLGLREHAADFDWVLPAHAKTPLPGGILDDLIAGVEAILAGRAVGQPHHTFAGDGLLGDFGSCGVVYRPDRLG